MYTIQGERKGEVGDNETLKTVNFQYPFHELDATRKLQAAKIKADAKGKGLDDKELNKTLNFTPKIDEIGFFGQTRGQEQLTGIYNKYANEMEKLRASGNLTPYNVRMLQMESKKEADRLNMALKGLRDLSSSFDSNLKNASQNKDIDAEELEWRKKGFSTQLNDRINKDPNEFYNVNPDYVNTVSQGILSQSFVDPETEAKITNEAQKLGEDIVKTESPNTLGGVSGIETKKQNAERVSMLKNTQYNNIENLNYYAKKWKDKQKRDLGTNYVSIPNDELRKNQDFQNWKNKQIDQTIDSTLDSTYKENVSVDNKYSIGSGSNNKTNISWKADFTNQSFLRAGEDLDSSVDAKNGDEIGGTMLTLTKQGGKFIESTIPRAESTVIDGQKQSGIPDNSKGTINSLTYLMATNKGGKTSIRTIERNLNQNKENLNWDGLSSDKYANGNSDFTGVLKFIQSKPKNEQAKYAKAFTDKYKFQAIIDGTIEDKAKSSVTVKPSILDGKYASTETTTDSKAEGAKSYTGTWSIDQYTIPRNLVKGVAEIPDTDPHYRKMESQAEAFKTIRKLGSSVPEKVVNSGQAGSRNQQKVKKETEYTTLKKYSQAPKK